MRINIEIDDDLMNRVLELTGLRTKREAVEMGLKALLKLQQQGNIRLSCKAPVQCLVVMPQTPGGHPNPERRELRDDT